MTALLEHRACPAVGAYLLHRIRDLMDARRLAVVCDECRFYRKRGKTLGSGSYAGWPRQWMRSGRGGTSDCPVTPSRLPR
jgi:hypothetical protein